MASPPANKLLTTGGFFPSPGATNPDYSVAGEVQPPTVDLLGFANIRGPVLTDEGGFRDPFMGAALGPRWTYVPGVSAGGSTTVGSSLVTFVSGLGNAAASLEYITTPIDFLPLAVNLYFDNTAGLSDKNAATAGIDFFWGLYDTEDPSLAAEFVEWVWPSAFGNTSSIMTTASAAGVANQETVGPAVNMRASTSAGWSTIVLTGDSAVFRDNALITLPTATVRNTRSIQLPGLYTPLNLAMGFRLTAGVKGTGWTCRVNTAFTKNTDILITTTVL